MGPNRWLHIPEGVPCVYDIDVRSVTNMGAWTVVKRRILSASNSRKELRVLLSWHPHVRMLAGSGSAAVNTVFLRGPEFLPLWLRERIAVLNIAPDSTFVAGVGMRWGGTQHGEDNNKWYTIVHGTEGIEP